MKTEKQEVYEVIGVSENQSQDEIFETILGNISKVEFRNLAGELFRIDPEKKLEQKHYLVIAIDEVMDKAKELGYHLAMNNGLVYVYNGQYWVAISESKLSAFLGVASQKMGVDMIESKFFRFRENLVNQFYSSAYFSKPETSQDKVLINLLNGTFEITSDKQALRHFESQDFLRYQLKFPYDINAKCPVFLKYLNQVLPDQDLQNILAEYIGYVFIKNLKLEKVLLLYGLGANGKSVFFEVVNAVLGKENVSNFSLVSLGSESYRSHLEEKLLNYGSEIKGSLESDIFKQLASGEPIGAKRLYKDPFIMRDYAKLMFNANELPKDVEHNEAFFRRFLIIPFLVTIADEDRDPELPKKIIANELSGVFNWVLDGLERVLENKGFSHSKASKDFLEKYKNESDTIALFLEDFGYQPCYDGNGTPLSELYSTFKQYCNTGGYYANNLKNFRIRLENRKLQVVKKSIGLVVSTIKMPLF